MEEDEKEEQFWLLSKERQENLRGIIAVMGLPCTLKTFLAESIGAWAKCEVLCIQDFVDDYDNKAISEAVEEDIQAEVDRRHQLLVQRAFPRLCKVAKFHLSRRLDFRVDSTVVIKSRLKSTFELDRLIELASRAEYPLLIIDCCARKEFTWKRRFEARYKGRDDDDEFLSNCGYRPASWKDMEDLIARDRDYEANWVLHLQQLLTRHSHVVVRRLVVDPLYDNTMDGEKLSVTCLFGDVVKYLLSTPQQELVDHFQNPYRVEYSELRPYLLEKRLSAAELRGRRKDLCLGGDCVFKYMEALILDDDDQASPASSNSTCCGVCEEQVVAETPAYTCRKCILTLHKSCAERVDFKALLVFSLTGVYNSYEMKNLACGSCVNAGKDFDDDCGSCLSKMHLKCGPLPTIIVHDFHPHFLSLYLTHYPYPCTACSYVMYGSRYRCMQCGLFYHAECAFLPLELLKHKHGGHEHVMKLMYSLHEDGMEQEEETYWCEVCSEDMDPDAWCYSCQDCPYYVTHVACSDGYNFLHYPKDVKLIQQLQPQLENAFPEIFQAGHNEE